MAGNFTRQHFRVVQRHGSSNFQHCIFLYLSPVLYRCSAFLGSIPCIIPHAIPFHLDRGQSVPADAVSDLQLSNALRLLLTQKDTKSWKPHIGGQTNQKNVCRELVNLSGNKSVGHRALGNFVSTSKFIALAWWLTQTAWIGCWIARLTRNKLKK